MAHMVFADANHHGRRDHHLRLQSPCHFGGNVHHAPPVVLHGQVFQMLLGGGHRNNASLELSGLHPCGEIRGA